ncbi:DDHD domain protein [Aspergillus luchuensis]|uniref:DDHD domain protein n=1 Tax=Aspergillus kawachii TaxID=1069201 RepID=A0A146FZQ2_ASPKA|nr:DDHD domain protein [Aspergillus luchuensis]
MGFLIATPATYCKCRFLATLELGFAKNSSNYVAFFYANRVVTIFNSHRICSLSNALARAPSYRALKSLMSKDSQRGTFFGAFTPGKPPRSTTPQPDNGTKDLLQRSRGEDHTVSHRHGLSPRRYPKDCPPLKVRWFYAVDSPKWKPGPRDQKGDSKPLAPPKKFVPFISRDSEAVEDAFQALLQSDVENEHDSYSRSVGGASSEPTKVPVNEDSLFDVIIEQRELRPAYWTGPVYEVRRGTWFFQDGSTTKPCEENLATQLEEGYLKSKPWRYTSPTYSAKFPVRTNDNEKVPGSSNESENLGHTTPVARNEPETYRLFGAYMNSIVTYQDSKTALLVNDDFMSRVSTTVYQKLGGIPGTKLVRGYNETNKQKEAEDKSGVEMKSSGEELQEVLPGDTQERTVSQMGGPFTSRYQTSDDEGISVEEKPTVEQRVSTDMAELEERARKQAQREMEDSRKVEDKDRGIDHLVLVTHGIGQRLGMRLESVNFIHDINVLRKTLKSVYRASPDLQALNSDFPDKHENCRIQVLPVCWRHLLDFPYQKEHQSRTEFDLGDAKGSESTPYPSLSDVTLDNIPAVRGLISDLAMDVLLYQSDYCEHISRIVKQECNRILDLFKKRNPSFRGSMLKGKTIAGRPQRQYASSTRPEGENGTVKSQSSSSVLHDYGNDKLQHHTLTSISSPKCRQLFNIFHPSDPVSYRLEPLISPAMSSLKPQPLPSVKRGIWTTSGQSLSLISSRVGQSVGSLWTNFTSGVASSLLNRSLGLTSEDTASSEVGLNTTLHAQKSQSSADPGSSHQTEDIRNPTLIDSNLETLYEGYRKAGEGGKPRDSQSNVGDSFESLGTDHHGRRLMIEDAKVRTLNSNGRVDYSIQE